MAFEFLGHKLGDFPVAERIGRTGLHLPCNEFMNDDDVVYIADRIREFCINKGFSLEDFRKALRICKDAGSLVKAYLLLKPPFLTEEEAIQDAVASGIEAWGMGVDRLSYNPVNVQRWTLVEHLWRRGEYRPQWLWSVLEVLEKVRGEVSIPVLSHPTAAGKRRGPHNCGACDSAVHSRW